MTYLFEFYDSEVASVAFEGQSCTIIFAAAHVRTLLDRREGYLTNVRCILERPASSMAESGSFGRLHSGRWISSGSATRAIEIPCESESTVTLELSFANGTEFSCTAENARVVITDGEFVESLKC